MSNILIIAPNTDTKVAQSAINSSVHNDLTPDIFSYNFKVGLYQLKWATFTVLTPVVTEQGSMVKMQN